MDDTMLSLLHIVDNSQNTHFLLGCFNVFTLFLSYSCTKAIQSPAVLCIINSILKEQLQDEMT